MIFVWFANTLEVIKGHFEATGQLMCESSNQIIIECREKHERRQSTDR